MWVWEKVREWNNLEKEPKNRHVAITQFSVSPSLKTIGRVTTALWSVRLKTHWGCVLTLPYFYLIFISIILYNIKFWHLISDFGTDSLHCLLCSLDTSYSKAFDRQWSPSSQLLCWWFSVTWQLINNGSCAKWILLRPVSVCPTKCQAVVGKNTDILMTCHLL